MDYSSNWHFLDIKDDITKSIIPESVCSNLSKQSFSANQRFVRVAILSMNDDFPRTAAHFV